MMVLRAMRNDTHDFDALCKIAELSGPGFTSLTTDRDLLQHKILDFGRYWRRHCAHLGRFRDFARDFPRAVDEQLRAR